MGTTTLTEQQKIILGMLGLPGLESVIINIQNKMPYWVTHHWLKLEVFLYEGRAFADIVLDLDIRALAVSDLGDEIDLLIEAGLSCYKLDYGVRYAYRASVSTADFDICRDCCSG
jgi:hypothetical protein